MKEIDFLRKYVRSLSTMAESIKYSLEFTKVDDYKLYIYKKNSDNYYISVYFPKCKLQRLYNSMIENGIKMEKFYLFHGSVDIFERINTKENFLKAVDLIIKEFKSVGIEFTEKAKQIIYEEFKSLQIKKPEGVYKLIVKNYNEENLTSAKKIAIKYQKNPLYRESLYTLANHIKSNGGKPEDYIEIYAQVPKNSANYFKSLEIVAKFYSNLLNSEPSQEDKNIILEKIFRISLIALKNKDDIKQDLFLAGLNPDRILAEYVGDLNLPIKVNENSDADSMLMMADILKKQLNENKKLKKTIKNLKNNNDAKQDPNYNSLPKPTMF